MSERERIRYQGSSGLSIGSFRARVADPWFRDSGPTGAYLFVFPRSAVTITHAGERTVVADRNTVMFYNRHQSYTRGALSPVGDRCDWFAVPAEAAIDAVAAHDPGAVDRPDRPFGFSDGPCSAAIYARQRRAVQAGARPGTDEEILDLLREVVAAAHRARGRSPVAPSPRAIRARRELVDAARSLVAVHYRERPSLADVAGRLRVSPFHLSRAFKEQTGTGLQQHVTQLRLRRALELVEDPRCSLTEIALDLGFSSHSHFTAAFHRAFAEPPSRARDRAARPVPAHRKRRKR